jgi:hypothetical protein
MKTLSFCLTLMLAAGLYAGDYKLVDQLPGRMATAMKQFHQLADSGIGSNMKDATRTLISDEQDMIRELAQTYYQNKTVSWTFLQRYFEDVENIVDADRELDNPSGESRGSMESLEALSDVEDRLGVRITKMVKAITENDPSYFKAWKKKWDSACTTGN